MTRTALGGWRGVLPCSPAQGCGGAALSRAVRWGGQVPQMLKHKVPPHLQSSKRGPLASGPSALSLAAGCPASARGQAPGGPGAALACFAICSRPQSTVPAVPSWMELWALDTEGEG